MSLCECYNIERKHRKQIFADTENTFVYKWIEIGPVSSLPMMSMIMMMIDDNDDIIVFLHIMRRELV